MVLALEPLATTDAHAYWRVFISGRSDLPTDDLMVHMDRYLALPAEEQRTHFAFREDGRIVGTIRMVGGTPESPDASLSGFSIDPSRADLASAAIVKAIDTLRAKGTSRITATFEDRYEPAFAAVGFRPWFSRMRMVAPVERRPVPEGVRLQPPEETEVPGLTKFFMDVYDGHLEQSFGMHVGPESDWRAYVGALLKGESGRFMPDASFVSVDDGRLVGAILVTHWMGDPLVAEVGVAKDRRGKGLGAALLQASMNRLAGVGEARLALFVTVGNDPAIRLYRRLGFEQAGGRSVTGRLAEDSQV
jgi:ribosomal protein S18 acetylase RimI-like enzyme